MVSNGVNGVRGNQPQMSFNKRYLCHLKDKTSLATKTVFGGAFPSILAVEGGKVPDLEAKKKAGGVASGAP